MTPEQIYNDAIDAKKQGSSLGVTLLMSGQRPKGFPRGEFLSDTGRGKLYRYDPDKIINWYKGAYPNWRQSQSRFRYLLQQYRCG